MSCFSWKENLNKRKKKNNWYRFGVKLNLGKWTWVIEKEIKEKLIFFTMYVDTLLFFNIVSSTCKSRDFLSYFATKVIFINLLCSVGQEKEQLNRMHGRFWHLRMCTVFFLFSSFPFLSNPLCLCVNSLLSISFYIQFYYVNIWNLKEKNITNVHYGLLKANRRE